MNARRHALRLCFFVALCCGASVALDRDASAYPVIATTAQLPSLAGSHVSELAAFAYDAPRDGFAPIAFQVQNIEDNGTLSFKGFAQEVDGGKLRPPAAPPAHAPTKLTTRHRVVLSDRSFTACDQRCMASAREKISLRCGVPSGAAQGRVKIYRVALALKGTVAFLVDCGAPVVQDLDRPVSVDLEKRTLQSQLLRYTIARKNHMLLEDFALSPDGGKSYSTLLRDSEMHLYGKPKFFFPLHFTGDDVRSEVKRVLPGNLSTAGQLTFFLDVLSFKVSLNLRSEVSMYEDAIHVPVMLSLPVSGSMLRKGSGIYYGFKYPNGNFAADVATDLPRLDEGAAAIPFAPVRVFRLERDDMAVAVGLHMPRYFEAMGFSPALATPKELERISFPKTKADFGIYYDVTRLEKGLHRFDLWFYVGEKNEARVLERYAREGVRFDTSFL